MPKKTNLINDFSAKVRDLVKRIPRGETRNYQEIAKLAGNERASRAVANIMAKNFDPDIPCHRVIRKDGGLGGYNRGGTKAKFKILISEGWKADNRKKTD